MVSAVPRLCQSAAKPLCYDGGVRSRTDEEDTA